MILLFFLIVCLVAFLIPDSVYSLGVSTHHMSGAFTYCFAHANFIHYALNALSLAFIARPVHIMYTSAFGYVSPFRFALRCYLASVAVGILAAAPVPTVGASGIVFFLMGLLIALNPTRQQIESFTLVAVGIIIQLIFGKSNVLLHMYAFGLGVLHIMILKASDRNRLHRSK